MSDITKIKVDGEPESSYKLFPKNREFEKRAGGNTGSQSGVQSDWNQNDEAQPDYIKNRPFYTDAVETILVEESTVPFAIDGSGMYFVQFQSTFSATVGETYNVSWDGTVYECTCAVLKTRPAIGNLSIVGAGSDTGEPFIMTVTNGERINIVTADTSASHTISISGFVPEVVKIDSKYLPDNALNITGATVGQIAKITAVDDSGKPTAWEAVDMPSGVGGGEITTLHINVTAVNKETMEATFTADKTPTEMEQASCDGPIWCVVTFAAGLMAEEAVSIGVPPAWYGGPPAFGRKTADAHNDNGNNKTGYVVRSGDSNLWIFDATQFGG